MSAVMLRSRFEQDIHDQVVSLIAASRFNIDGWEVTANCGANGKCDADIVASNTGELVALGEVETHNTITDTEAFQWRKFGESCSRFYLFVPEGTEGQAIDLIEKHRVVCAGLRCYSIEDDNLNVRSIALQNSHSQCNDHSWWSDIGKAQE